MSMKNSDTIGNRTRDLPVCRAVPQPLRHRVPHVIKQSGFITELTTDCESFVSDILKILNICHQHLACFDIRGLSFHILDSVWGQKFVLHSF
jgi:hypothetical protein